MVKRQKLAAALFSAVYILILLFSVLFIAAEADHSCCVKESCPICCQINICNGTLKNIGACCVDAFILLTAVFAAVFVIGVKRYANSSTLITLKVKLSA